MKIDFYSREWQERERQNKQNEKKMTEYAMKEGILRTPPRWQKKKDEEK